MKTNFIITALQLLILFGNIVVAQIDSIKAFPGAEGSGAFALGGRYGSVYRVTNLNTSGPGSFHDAVSQPNRIIIFTVSGIIDYKNETFYINKDNLTIAGQTAPGNGICFKGTCVRLGGKDVIVRHLRSRVGYIESDGKPQHRDGFSIDIDGGENIIADHISVSWASDENLTHANDTKNVTVQNCFIAEGLNYYDPNNSPNQHGFGSIIGSDLESEVNFHHNLYAHHEQRAPRFASRDGNRNLVDFRNNVIYDCYNQTGLNNPADSVNTNYINNYLKYGPNTPNDIKYNLFNIRGKYIRMYANGSYIFENPEFSTDNWKSMTYKDGASEQVSKVNTPFLTSSVTTESAEDAYKNVLNFGGAILPSRDFNDMRIADDVANGSGIMIEYESDLGENPWGEYYSLPYPDDLDEDGMPDFWEDQFGLDKSNAADNMTLSSGGYTNIEHYINNTDPTDSLTPIVYVGAYRSRVTEDGTKNGSFRIYRTSGVQQSLTIKYTLSGEAVNEEDYKLLSGACTIEAGETFKEVEITPIEDNINEGDEKVIVTLDRLENNYNIGCPSQTLVVINDPQNTTGIEKKTNLIPSTFELKENFPNPFNPTTQIKYSIDEPGFVSLEIFEVLGSKVTTLVSEFQTVGEYTLTWNAKNSIGVKVASGTYICRLNLNGKSLSTKMALLK
ncbi:MAG: T9SS type A sorting domain-containing protein [Bacteroidetes bacterium]|nr:T9SS type A sorting domain-containing protein [Bacteroidota bacterium]